MQSKFVKSFAFYSLMIINITSCSVTHSGNTSSPEQLAKDQIEIVARSNAQSRINKLTSKNRKQIAHGEDADVPMSASVSTHNGPFSQAGPELQSVIRTSAANGDPSAQSILAYVYYLGDGVKIDYMLASTMAEKAAIQGDIEAQQLIGSMYLHGFGVNKDKGKAFGWLTKSANKGNAMAQAELGRMYACGDAPGNPGLRTEELSNMSINSIKTLRERNNSMASYQKQGARWSQMAACQNDAYAQYDLWMRYSMGQGVDEDRAEGYAWLIISSENGFPPARDEMSVATKLLAPGDAERAHERVRVIKRNIIVI